MEVGVVALAEDRSVSAAQVETKHRLAAAAAVRTATRPTLF